MATPTKTKELIRPIPINWWLKKPSYTRFMIRDATSIFIAGYCIFLIYVMVGAEHDDATRFDAFYRSWGSPLSQVLHLIALCFALYHSITFFNLTPRVMVLFRGEEKVPEGLIAGAHYALWGILSILMIVIVMVWKA